MTISETSVTSLPEESRTSNDSQRNTVNNATSVSEELALSPEEATLLWNALSTHLIQWNSDGTPPIILSSIHNSHDTDNHRLLNDSDTLATEASSRQHDTSTSWHSYLSRMGSGLMALVRSNQSFYSHSYDAVPDNERGHLSVESIANNQDNPSSTVNIALMPLSNNNNNNNSSNHGNDNNTTLNRSWAAQDPAIEEIRVYCAEERRRLRSLLVHAMSLLSLVVGVFGIILYNMDAFYGPAGSWDTRSRGWHLYMGFVLFCGVISLMLLLAYGIRIAELHLHFTTTVQDRATSDLLERYQQHRQRQIQRMHRTTHHSSFNNNQGNGEDDDEDEDEEEEDVPLAHRLAYERRRLNRRFQRAIENQVQVRRHNSRSRSNQDTLDVDPTRLAPPPPTYAEANIDPPAYDTVKPASSQSSLADISAGTSDNNEIQQDAHASTSTSMTAVIATENEEEDME